MQKEIPINDLVPHDTSEAIFRQGRPDDRFIQDIRANGIEQRIVVNENNEILDGVRRYRAVKEIEGEDSIKCIVRSFDDEEKAILRLNDDRAETFRQKMEVAMRYKEKAEDALDARMKLGKSVDELDPEEDPAQEFAEGDNATAMELAADRVGWSEETLRKAEQIWRMADPPSTQRVDEDDAGNLPYRLVEAINIGDMSISAAYQEYRDWLHAQQGRAKVQWSEFMDVTNWDQLFDLYESSFEANLADVDADDDWQSQIETLRGNLESTIDNFDQLERADFVFAWHLEKRGLLDFDGEEGPESIVAREPDKGELERLYWEEDYTIGELAMNYGVNVELIKAWMRDKGVSLKLDTIQDSQANERLSHRSDIVPDEVEMEDLPDDVTRRSI